MNHCNCHLQGPGSNIFDFAIKLTTSRVGKVRIASHMRLFDPRNVALQLFGRNTVDLFCFATAFTPPISSSCVVEDFFFARHDSPVATLPLFYFSASGSLNENFAHP